MKTIDLKKIIKTALVMVLIFNFMIALFFSIINPEDYFFGSKFSGKNAMIYLIGNGVIGLLIVYALYRKEKKGIYLSFLFFGYNFLNVLVTNIIMFNFYGLSWFFLFGLIIAVFAFILYRRKRSPFK